MELHLGLALSTSPNLKLCSDNHLPRPVPRTLPLFFWSTHPNEDRDPPHDPDNDPAVVNENDEGGIVGWPPIKSWRRKVMNHGGAGNYRCRRAGPNSKYVKVKMEGVGIARKVDLSLYDSHQSLVDTLTRRMFHVYRGSNSMDDYKLVYQDGEGDWLLAADVPWRTFVRNAQRLKLAKTSYGV